MSKEVKKTLEELQQKIALLRDRFDLEKKKQEVIQLETLSQEEGFWDDSVSASKMMQKLERLKEDVSFFDDTQNQLNDLSELLEMSEDEKDVSEIEKQVAIIQSEIEIQEFKALLGGEYDENDAILTITAGVGGVDAQDWAEMLMRMYLRWAEKRGFKSIVIDESRGGEAGIKSVTIEIEGAYVFGYLKREAGSHRLVRLSPFNSDNLRQTSFASVEVLPVIEDAGEIKIDESDLRIDTFRSSGAGGQSVNTTDSAVRITHTPTGIVASCQTERSQLQNKERAMKLLLSKLHKKHIEEKEEEKRKMSGVSSSADWGSQIRSYVLHPYKLVKDHRTKYEEKDTEKVLDGEIDGFIENELVSIT
ncbi:MAG: peptide chain release factor 2 [Candidatus Moranbacteria bacterium]|nr:peptide chain release factor 2 [Candidatus Moranbacteria bacterium]